MKRFPNAAKGVSNLFTSQILALIATLAMGVELILTVVFAGSLQVKSQIGAGASGIGLMVFGIGAAVLIIIGLILYVVGLVQASKDEESFKTIIKLMIFSLIVAVIAALFSKNALITNLANAISNVITLISSILVIIGIANLAAQLNDKTVIEKCNGLLKVILWTGILALALRFFALFMPSTLAAAIVILLLVASMVLSFVHYILYLSLLSRAKKMLN